MTTSSKMGLTNPHNMHHFSMAIYKRMLLTTQNAMRQLWVVAPGWPADHAWHIYFAHCVVRRMHCTFKAIPQNCFRQISRVTMPRRLASQTKNTSQTVNSLVLCPWSRMTICICTGLFVCQGSVTTTSSLAALALRDPAVEIWDMSTLKTSYVFVR